MIFEKFISANSERQPRPPIPPEMRRRLVQEFNDDITVLSRLLDRDLSHWTVT